MHRVIIYVENEPPREVAEAVREITEQLRARGERIIARNPHGFLSSEREPADLVIVQSGFEPVLDDYRNHGVDARMLEQAAEVMKGGVTDEIHEETKAGRLEAAEDGKAEAKKEQAEVLSRPRARRSR